MTSTKLVIESAWERPALAESDGASALMIRLVAPGFPLQGARKPIDLSFVLDRSGSMDGRPLELAKQAVSQAAGMLDQRDRAALVVFDDRVDVLHHLSNMDGRQRSEMRRTLTHVNAGGSTDLCGGWLAGCRELARHPASGERGRVQRAVVLTDGLANHGETSVGAICGHATELRRRGVTTTALGMGYSFDEQLLSSMAEAGGGNFAYVASEAKLAGTFERELNRLTAITTTCVNVSIQLPRGLRGRLLSPFPVERAGRRFDVAIDDLAAADEVAIVFEITSRDVAIGARLPVEISVRWTDAATGLRHTEDAEVAPLLVVDERVLAAIPRSDAVTIELAKQRAAADQRRAMDLDRAGRFAESRHVLQKAADELLQAPDSADILLLRTEAQAYAGADASTPLTEHTRKQAVHNSVARSRRRQPIGGEM